MVYNKSSRFFVLNKMSIMMVTEYVTFLKSPKFLMGSLPQFMVMTKCIDSWSASKVILIGVRILGEYLW